MSQIAFFTRDGDMRDRRTRISRPKRGALIRATFPTLAPMGARHTKSLIECGAPSQVDVGRLAYFMIPEGATIAHPLMRDGAHSGGFLCGKTRRATGAGLS